MGGNCEVNIKKGYPVLVNEKNTSASVKKYLKEYLGKENVIDLDKKMTAEDFAYYSQVCPGTLFRLGVGNQSKNINSPLHTATFNVDENCLKTGMETLSWLAISFLKEQHE